MHRPRPGASTATASGLGMVHSVIGGFYLVRRIWFSSRTRSICSDRVRTDHRTRHRTRLERLRAETLVQSPRRNDGLFFFWFFPFTTLCFIQDQQALARGTTLRAPAAATSDLA